MKSIDEVVAEGWEKGATGAWVMGVVDEMGEH